MHRVGYYLSEVLLEKAENRVLSERCIGREHFESRGRKSREKGSGGSSVQTHDDSARMCLGGHRIRFKSG